jgi:Tat protein translocase TatB subunit
MLLQVMLFTGPIAQIVAHRMAIGNPVVERATLSIPDTMFLFVVALVVFGPKRLPEIGKQIGKLVFEFRRASNDFKLQIEEELRVAEQQDRQKQIEQVAVSKPSTPAVAGTATTRPQQCLERAATLFRNPGERPASQSCSDQCRGDGP